jgi:hypothetical protein
MTDKQIIIDGTHCRYAHFDGGNTQRLLCAIDDCFCDCYRDNECYYKQLKRKEQECEELKKEIAFGNNGTLSDKIRAEVFKELNNENKKLKAENDTYKKMLEDEDVQLALTEIRSGERHLWYNKADKLSKTLTEIKEIAEICKCHNADGCYECKYFDDCEVEDEEIPTRDVCKLILQKISECEGNDENN